MTREKIVSFMFGSLLSIAFLPVQERAEKHKYQQCVNRYSILKDFPPPEAAGASFGPS
jgi:hypothetical protein